MKAASWLLVLALTQCALAQRAPEPALVSVVVDFLPLRHPPSQLIVNFNRRGATAELRMPNGERVSYVAWDEATAKGTLDEMWEALAKSPERIQQEAGLGQRDGTLYNFRIRTLKADISLSLLDDEAQDQLTGRVAMVRWANAVRLDVAK